MGATQALFAAYDQVHLPSHIPAHLPAAHLELARSNSPELVPLRCDDELKHAAKSRASKLFVTCQRLQARPRAGEAFGGVTATALGSELAAMNVIGAMACDTGARLIYAVAHWSRVAGFALQSDVGAG